MASLDAGGTERMRLNLADEWLKRGVECDFVVSRKTGALLNSTPKGSRVFALGQPSILKFIPKFRAYLRVERPTHVLVAGLDITALVLLTISGMQFRPTIAMSVHSHVSDELVNATWRRRTKDRVALNLIKVLAPHVDCVIAVADELIEDLSVHLPSLGARAQTIHNPTVTRKLLQNIEASRTRPLGPEQPWFLYVGRLSPEKGVDILLRAFERVRASPPCQLVILGDGPEASQLRELCRALNIEKQVSFLGYKPEPERWMTHARALVLPSRYEGLPNVLIEALACGCQVIASDCAGGPKKILDGGRLGQVVAVDDAESMANAMLNVLRDDFVVNKEDMVQRAQLFSADTAAKLYLNAMGIRNGDRINAAKKQ